MKLSKNWKRIFAGMMAAIMVFLSVDAGCLTALAAEIQKIGNESTNNRIYPTGGLLSLKGVEGSASDLNAHEIFKPKYNNGENSEETYDWSKHSTYLIYNQLSPEWQAIWDDMDALCLEYLTTDVDGKVEYSHFDEEYYYFTKEFELAYDITTNDFGTLYFLFMSSNPQYYFLGYSGYEYVYSDGDNYIDLAALGIYQEFIDGEERLATTEAFLDVINNAYSEVSESDSDALKLKKVHDYIVNNVEYNYDVLENDGGITNAEEAVAFTQSAYSAFCLDYTVCAGYSEALQLLCNGLDIDAMIVTSVDHQWNKVRINDCWYNVDPTWADNGKDTEGNNYPIYYGYYGRSDAYYLNDTSSVASSHIEEAIWSSYLPAAVKDTNPTENYAPGEFFVPTITLPTPVITARMNNEQKYEVTITLEDEAGTFEDAIIYYTLDETVPSATAKSGIYQDTFVVDADVTIKAIAVLDGYNDSDVSLKKAISTLSNATIQNHFYKELTFTWDALGEIVDGYTINVYNAGNNTKIGQSIDVIGGTIDYYAYDTSQLTDITSIYYEISGYILDAEQNQQIVTNVVKSPSENINLLTQPLDVKVKWHVTKNDDVKYLVINVEETTQQQLCLWYYSDENGVDLEKTFTLNMTSGVNEFKYSLDSHGITYDQVGYIYITDGSKTTAFQKESFAVGGEYKTPVLNSIADIDLHSTGQTAVLEASITDDSLMENFNYKYQWYIAEDSTSEGTAITGATKPSYTTHTGSFDEEYYYCIVTVEYLENMTFKTDNGSETEVANTRVEGALYGTKISPDPIANRVFTGDPITVDDLVLKNALDAELVLGTDYTIVGYENNTNAGDAFIIVDFIGEYGDLIDARINFKILQKPVTDDTSKYDFTDITTGKTYTYNGSEHLPAMSVKDIERNYVLVKDIDYNIEYRGNVDAGTATIVLEFKGNYDGQKEILFKIQPKSSENVVISPIGDITYTGKEIIPELLVKDNEIFKTLELNKDYKIVSCVNNITVGGATITIEFIKNYDGPNRELNFNIIRKNASDEDVLITAIKNQEYTGKEIKPVFEVVYNGLTLKEGTDYTATYSSNKALGDATIDLTFRNNFEGTKSTTFKIVKRDAANLSYSYFTDVYTYDRTEHKLENIVVKNGDITLVENVDYIVRYEGNVDAGTAKAIVKFDDFEGCSGNYTGTKILEFQIAQRDAKEHCEVKLELPDELYIFNGTEFKPGVIVMDGDIKLEERTEEMALDEGDYIVSYINNINAGQATVTITFINNYTGETSQTFTIDRKPISEDDIEVESITDQVYKGAVIIPENIIVKEKLSENETAVVLRPGVDYTVSAGSENIYVGEGVVIIHIELEGESNYIYEGEDIEVNFNIVARDASDVEISPIPAQRYTGEAITPVLEVKDGDIILVQGVDYTVTYENNVEVGTEAKVTISFTGNFTGEDISATFTIIDPIPEYITSSVFHVSEVSGYISKITVGTTVYTLLQSINETEYVSILDKNGAGVSGENMLTTGMTANIMDVNEIVKRYTIIVTGDTNGDGKINITDMIAVKACSLKKSDLSGAYEKAADVNGDGKINITDFIKVKATTLKKDTITGVAVN